MSRRIDKDKLMNPTLVAFDDVGGDWHVRIGTIVGDPFTFVTADEARQVALAWADLATRLADREGNPEHRQFCDALTSAVLDAMGQPEPENALAMHRSPAERERMRQRAAEYERTGRIGP